MSRGGQGFLEHPGRVQQHQHAEPGQGEHDRAPAKVGPHKTAHRRCEHRRQALDGHQQGEDLRGPRPFGHIADHAHDHHQGQCTAQALDKARRQQCFEAGCLGRGQRTEHEHQQPGQQRPAPAQGVDQRAEQQLAGAHGQQKHRQRQLHPGIGRAVLGGDARHAGQVHVDGRRPQGADQRQGHGKFHVGGLRGVHSSNPQKGHRSGCRMPTYRPVGSQNVRAYTLCPAGSSQWFIRPGRPGYGSGSPWASVRTVS